MQIYTDCKECKYSTETESGCSELTRAACDAVKRKGVTAPNEKILGQDGGSINAGPGPQPANNADKNAQGQGAPKPNTAPNGGGGTAGPGAEPAQNKLAPLLRQIAMRMYGWICPQCGLSVNPALPNCPCTLKKQAPNGKQGQA